MKGRGETHLQPVILMVRHGSLLVEIVADASGSSMTVMMIPLPSHEPPLAWPHRRDEIRARDLS